MTWKTVSCKIDEEDFDTLQNCIENGGAGSISEFLRDAIQHEIENCVISLESEEDTLKPTLTKIIQGEVIEPIKLTCKNGELWTHWNSDRVRIKYGNCADYDLKNGEVFKDGSLIGIIENQD